MTNKEIKVVKIVKENCKIIEEKDFKDNTEKVKQVIINCYEDCGFGLKSRPRKSKLGGYYVDCGYGFPRRYTKLVEVEKISDSKRLMRRVKHETTSQIIFDDDKEEFINSLEMQLQEALIRKN